MISKRQLEILRHALGWPKNYRNRFCTWPGTKDYADCEALVAERRDYCPDGNSV
jgi:hypothetical protein